MSLPMLQTARLLLRPPQEGDAEGLHTAYGIVSRGFSLEASNGRVLS
jgi:hypothetical protein